MSRETKPNLYQDIMDVLRKHAEGDPQYWNPFFLSKIEALLEERGVEDDIVSKWIKDMWGY